MSTTSPERPTISEFNPDWAPDGRTIVFQRSQGNDHDIWTMRPDGGVQYLITRNDVFDGFASYFARRNGVQSLVP